MRRSVAFSRTPGNERQADDDEVEDVPAVLEEVLRPRAERGDADDQLDDEDPQEDVVERGEKATRRSS